MEEFFFTEIFSACYLYYSPSCKSTGELSKQCAEKYKNQDPIVVYTFDQTSGKGQGTNTWESEAGKNIAVTFVFHTRQFPEFNPVLFNKAVSLGVKNALETCLQQNTFIKWPNDIYCQDKKICGLLLESYILENGNRVFSAGIGINVNQLSWNGNFNASSLYAIAKKEFNLMNVLHELIYSISYYINILKISKTLDIHSLFNQSLYRLNQPVTLVLQHNNEELHGILTGVDEAGRISLQTDTGISNFHHGQARLKK